MTFPHILFTFFLVILAAVPIALVYRLYTRGSRKVYRFLLIHLIFLNIFLIINLVARNFVSRVLSTTTAGIDSQISIGLIMNFLVWPCLLIAVYMLIRFGFEITNTRLSRWVKISFLIFAVVGTLLFAKLLVDAGSKKVSGWEALDSSAGVVTGNILIVIFICIPFVRMIFFNRKVPEEKARRAVRTLGIIYFGIYFLWFLYIYILQDWFVFNYYLSNAFIFLINLPPVLYLQLGLSQLLEKPTQEDIELLSGFCGKYDLTERETELVKLICDGRTNSEISEILFVSLQTVKNSVHQIFRKTGVRTRVNLINKVREE